MRLTVILGLDHVEPDMRNQEAQRILTELAQQIGEKSPDVGDTHILTDEHGQRVGVADVFAS